jgi:Flp pilus assembly protein TadG
MIRDLEIQTLRTFTERWHGVKAYKDLVTPLYFPHCKAVHTFGVKPALDLLWVSKNGTILRCDRAVKANRIKACFKAFGVVEIASEPQRNFKAGARFKLPGQALVESALVLPVLFLLLFGFLELSLMLQAQQRLTHSVQMATQVLSLTNSDEKLSGALAELYAPSALTKAIENTSTSTNTVITASERRYNDTVKVKLTQPYVLNIPFLELSPFNLSAQASARILCQNTNAPYQCD